MCNRLVAFVLLADVQVFIFCKRLILNKIVYKIKNIVVVFQV
jgi:hypothetical protein